MFKSPCKDCPDRYPACQDKCAKIQAARAEHEKCKAWIRAEALSDTIALESAARHNRRKYKQN